MYQNQQLPRVVLICHDNDPIDARGLAAWLGCSFRLAGRVLLRERSPTMLQKLRREYRRVGALRLLDVLMFRLYYRLRHASEDARWIEATTRELEKRYPVDLDAVPAIASYSPNTGEVRDFLRELQPDLIIARCKCLLKPDIFNIPAKGTYVLHPGICPEYRNAHGCFWALVNRDFEHVGMTLLKVDPGVDTGPIYLQSTCSFNELDESHVVIQYRVVLENLDAVAAALYKICNGTASPLPIANRFSMSWGQPWLTAWLNWKRAAKETVYE